MRKGIKPLKTGFFYTPIIVQWSDNYKKFKVVEPISMDLDDDSFMIPKDFRTDFGSIPLIFKPFFNPIGKEVPAYVLHDYLCSQSNKGLYIRELADKKLEEALAYLGTSIYRRKMIYFGVRVMSFYKKVEIRCSHNF